MMPLPIPCSICGVGFSALALLAKEPLKARRQGALGNALAIATVGSVLLVRCARGDGNVDDGRCDAGCDRLDCIIKSYKGRDAVVVERRCCAGGGVRRAATHHERHGEEDGCDGCGGNREPVCGCD